MGDQKWRAALSALGAGMASNNFGNVGRDMSNQLRGNAERTANLQQKELLTKRANMTAQYLQKMGAPQQFVDMANSGAGKQAFDMWGAHQKAQQPKERKFTLDRASDRNRYVDTGELVFPNAQPAETPYDWDSDRKLRKEWTGLPSVRAFNKQTSAFGRIVASAKDPSPAGDLALIFNFMKVLDPGSTVREGEFATAQNSGGVPDRVWGAYNRVMSGVRLTPQQRQDFVGRAQGLYQEAEQGYLSRREQYSSIAEAQKLNPEYALPDFRRTGEMPNLDTGKIEDMSDEQLEAIANGR